MEGKGTAHKAQSWAGAKLRWGSIMEGLECFREVLTPPDMEHCKVLGQREFFAETRIWGKSHQKGMER